ncbi:hypothetical protein M426DRAFT_318108 [Hypoxylon sp. CI-4A]|nr:hypothetical protein M426DRAFT_318108 [Hypoxylon sp. CI-4A]
MLHPFDIALLLVAATIIISRLFGTSNRLTLTPFGPVIMNRSGRARIARRRLPLIPRSRQEVSLEPPALTNTYAAKPQDVVEVKDVLSKARNLPPEIVDMILDRAEYWACSVAIIDYSNSPKGYLAIPGARAGEDQFLLRTEPLGLTKWSSSDQDLWRTEAAPKKLEEEYSQSDLEPLMEGEISTLKYPFRKVVFDIVSRDQGFSGHTADHGTYRSSFTWFDAGIDRFDKKNEDSSESSGQQSSGDSDKKTVDIPTSAIRPVWPPIVSGQGGEMRYDHQLHATQDHLIQRNKHATQDFQTHHIEWSWDDDIDPTSLEAQGLDESGRGTATGNGEFVRNLKWGDMITVWGRARFPGWSNRVKKVEVKVYWAF